MLFIKVIFGVMLFSGLLLMSSRGEPTERLAYYGGFALFTFMVLAVVPFLLIT